MSMRVPLALLALSAVIAGAGVAAERKEGIKGRYLHIEQGVQLKAYSGAVIVLEPTEITSDKDAPVDNEAVQKLSDEKLVAMFGGLGLALPAELPDDRPVVRATPRLTLQHGSQAMRFWVGAGAGKSKLHIRIEFTDEKSGSGIGFFNGYGTGAGLWSFSGGGVQRMAGDDLDENYNELARLLKEHMQ